MEFNYRNTQDPRTNTPACVTVPQVAETLDISEKLVKSFLVAGILHGEKAEGEWLVYLYSVMTYHHEYRLTEKTTLAVKTMAHLHRSQAMLLEQAWELEQDLAANPL